MATKKKVLFFSISLKKGGAETQLYRIASSLIKSDYRVSIFYFLPGNDFIQFKDSNRIEVKYFKLTSITGFFSLFKEFKKYSPDILISFMFLSNLLGRLFKLIYRVPLVTSVRNTIIPKKYYLIYKISKNIDDLTVFNSQEGLVNFISQNLSKKENSIVINNAITIEKNLPKPIKSKNDIFTLISVAHFRPQKDYQTLFESIALLKQDGFNVQLNVFGHLNGQNPEGRIKELGICENVKIFGFSYDLKQHIHNSDLLVLSSLWEGTPNAILEAMALGKPVIASDIPGVNSLLTASKAGLLFRVGDPEDLKEKIKKCISLNYDTLLEWGQNGRSYVENNYDENVVIKKWIKVIQSYS